MNKEKCSTSSKMVANKSKNKVLSCSTPERRQESPSRDSDSLCDSEAASPVPFLCTQDGAEGEIDVVWNFYTPKAEHAAKSRLKNSTPVSRRTKKIMKSTLIDKPLPKRRNIRATQKKTELFQDLIELNQNLHELMSKKSKAVLEEKKQSGSEEDIFSDSGDSSPKSGFRTNTRCLRRNVLSSKFKPEPEAVLESDDSMNECLIKASQVVEENILNEPTPAKRPCLKKDFQNIKVAKPSLSDSMDALFSSIKLPFEKTNDCERLNNDSFDRLVGNLNDSTLDRLTQMPVKSNNNRSKLKSTDWTVQEVIVHDSSPSKSFFGRYSSMPESPVVDINKPSTSGMVFGRYNSMPPDNNQSLTAGYSPNRCTQEEIKRKHQQAREKLLAKRMLPFTSTQQNSQLTQTQAQPIHNQVKKTQFQPRVPTNKNPVPIPHIFSKAVEVQPKNQPYFHTSKNQNPVQIPYNPSKAVEVQPKVDLKLLIEKKRQEALLKLRRRQPQKP